MKQQTLALPTKTQAPPWQRLQEMQSYCWATFNLGVRSRKELGRLTREYCDKHNLGIPLELLGSTVLFVLREGAQ